MNVKEVADILQAQILTEGESLETDVVCACGSDLMSDVMAYVKENVLLLTGLVNPQVIRTAEMMDIKVIVFVRGKVPDKNIIELAKEKGICVLSTRFSMFSACGRLYNAGIKGEVFQGG
ncbi:MAG: DRTGG domain-containing protein [Acetivibrionales bacterium]|jgi:predicted transcriptional regulator